MTEVNTRQDANPFAARWGTSSDSEWLTALLQAGDNPLVEGIPFPTLPDTEVQRTTHGNSAEIAVRGSFMFYRCVRDAIAAYDAPLRTNGRLLDFGSGWGRIIRPFMRDFQLMNLYAVDPSGEWCLTARRCNPYLAVIQSDPLPPLPFRDGFFDYIVAYSIFTHLPEYLFGQWMAEFERVLNPGGILAFTFLGDRMMKELNKYPQPTPPGVEVHFWHRILIDALANFDPKRRRYSGNEFVFLRTSESPLYGDTFMSPDLVRRSLQHRWQILQIDSVSLAQDLCLVRRLL